MLDHLNAFVNLCNEKFYIGQIRDTINHGYSLRNSAAIALHIVHEFDFFFFNHFLFETIVFYCGEMFKMVFLTIQLIWLPVV